MMKSLQAAPFQIDADAIADGLLKLFTDDERVILRFGMLPAEKMECVKKMMEEKFRECVSGGGGYCDTMRSDGDLHVAVCEPPIRGERYHEFSMKKLVSEAVHEVCLALYRIGDLVV